jgi:hypothetical protein
MFVEARVFDQGASLCWQEYQNQTTHDQDGYQYVRIMPALSKLLLKRLLHEDIDARRGVREPSPRIALIARSLGSRVVGVEAGCRH